MISFVSTGNEALLAIDGHLLTFGDSGYALYTAMRIPVSLNWTFLILESDGEVRELGCRIDTFASSALTLLAASAASQLPATAAIAKFVSRATPSGARARSRRRTRFDQQRAGSFFHFRQQLLKL